MSMTREEASVQIEGLKKYCEDMADSDESGAYVFDLDVQALDLALSALRPVSREWVEKVWRGCSDCARKTCVACKRFGWASRHCVDCENQSKWAPWNFCPVCGKPLTDEAVEMVKERLNKLEETKK